MLELNVKFTIGFEYGREICVPYGIGIGQLVNSADTEAWIGANSVQAVIIGECIPLIAYS